MYQEPKGLMRQYHGLPCTCVDIERCRGQAGGGAPQLGSAHFFIMCTGQVEFGEVRVFLQNTTVRRVHRLHDLGRQLNPVLRVYYF